LIAFFLVGATALGQGRPSIDLLLSIDNPTGGQSELFGYALDQFDGNILVGSAGGSVHVIDINDGSELLRITSPETEGLEITFGDAVTQVGTMIAAADTNLDIGGNVRVGSIYLFDGTTGAHRKTIRAPEPESFRRFATSLETASGRLFAADNSGNSNSPGLVRVFDPDTGQLLDTITNPDTGWGFGWDIEEHDGDTFISAVGNIVANAGGGAVYRFKAGSSIPSLTIPAPTSQTVASFGSSIETRGSHLLVGAPGVNTLTARRSGEAYLFDVDTATCC